MKTLQILILLCAVSLLQAQTGPDIGNGEFLAAYKGTQCLAKYWR